MQIRKTKIEELPILLEMYEDARRFMKENGNPNQWRDTEPKEERVRQDIEDGDSYVCVEENQIVATFFYKIMDDPTYQVIVDGKWLDDSTYGVVHRITTNRKTKGAASFCMNWAMEQSGGHIRIDTHEDNIVMQKLLNKLGFQHCGTIFVANGDKRWAYEKIHRV